MAVGPSAAEAATILATFSGAHVKLHIGDPGANGTANAATETTRKQVTLGAATVTAGQSDASSTADLEWTGIAGSQDPTHYSLWTAATAGTFRQSGTITSDAYVAGNTFRIPAGSFTLSMPVAS